MGEQMIMMQAAVLMLGRSFFGSGMEWVLGLFRLR